MIGRWGSMDGGGVGRHRCALLAVVTMTAAGLSGVVTGPASAATPASPITLGIHDGAINLCDRGGSQITSPTANDLAMATSSFTSKYWSPLKSFTVRFSPTWDIAYHHDGAANSTANRQLAVTQACLNEWLKGAAKVHARPEIAFKPDPNYRSPDVHTYRLAIDAFTRQYSNPANTHGMARVQIIAPWGEPDFRASGSNRIFMPKGGHEFGDPSCHGSPNVNTCGPILAAHMWRAVRSSCQQCNLLGKGPGSGVIAGDFSSLGGIEGEAAKPGAPYRSLAGSYLDTYRKNLGRNRPLVWALHPYQDIQTFEKNDSAHRPVPALSSTLVAAFARDLSQAGYHQGTQIWLNEISAFQGRNMSGDARPGWTQKVQAAAGHYLITGLPKAAGGANEPTVTRAYYLNFQGETDPNTRWALVLNHLRDPQLVYYTFVKR